MKVFYSAQTNGFYPDDIEFNNPPDDLIEIPEEYYKSLLHEQSQGKIITSDESGYPISIDRPTPGNDELRKIELTKLSADYQSDVQVLNIAWLSAAVSDGAGEGSKKDAVIAEIETRKAKYISDRAEIISKYQ
ncbi:hypothetical protein FDX24_05435 [Citrobacter sp. wls716]|uniref:hypothetical protein n=1 Tax=Citrobacter sp. wls716 TaxID=2576420 RepID=UPI0010C970CC|nr:hypothetical protein [Citrobacter sp. wls716]TKU44008.1 hypothetical protein FDX24_05435 [Citrobacter sp. wls716]